MASDLSTIIQDGLCTTLTSVLAIDAKLNCITKVHEKDLIDLELLKIKSEFEFANLTTTLSFIVPAYSASVIFNTMMGEASAEPVLTIDDDTIDAIGEFISQVSGGLTTAMNGSSLEDLGTVKFNISGSETLSSSATEDTENIYKFSIDLEEKEIFIFILFDENILPYIDDIAKSPVTEYPEKIEEPEEEEEEEPEEEIQIEEEPPIKDTKSEDDDEDDNEEEIKEEDPKEKKLKMLIIGIGGLAGFIIISLIVMYFMGIFDEPEPIVIKQESNATIETKNKVSVIKYNTLKKVDFKVSDINIQRLNIRLEALTKYKVLNKEELANQALAQKNILFELDKEKKLLEFAKKNKEELLSLKKKKDEIIDIDKKTKFLTPSYKIKEDNTKENNITSTTINTPIPTPIKEKIIVVKKEIEKNKDLKFILASSLKYKLFKELVKESKSSRARISICNDINGRTTIFIGPFENSKLQTKMQELVKERNKNIQTTISNITQKEFDIRCNF